MLGAKKDIVLTAGIILFIFLTSLALISPASAMSNNTDSRAESDENAGSYIYLDISQDSYEILPDSPVEFIIIVRNLGDVNLTYTPPAPSTLTLPQGWSIKFLPSSGLFIEANSFDYLTNN